MVGQVLGVGIHPVDLDVYAMCQTRVLEGLIHRHVCVMQLHVLAHKSNLHRATRGQQAVDKVAPVVELERAGQVEAQAVAHNAVEALRLHHERHHVDIGGILGRDDGLGWDTSVERDLLANVAAKRTIRSQHQDVGLDTNASQLVDRMLGRLGLQFAGNAEVWHEGDVHEGNTVAALLIAHLTDCLEKWQRLDVAHRAADLHNHHVGVG